MEEREYAPVGLIQGKGKLRTETIKGVGSIAYWITPLPDTDYYRGKCVAAPFKDYGRRHCSRAGKYEHRGLMFCKQHHPPNYFEKARARQEKWNAKFEEEERKRQHQSDLQAWRGDCLAALHEIAKGELNDPAGYAAMVLDAKPVLEVEHG